MVYTGYEVDPNAALNIIIEGQKYDLTKWKDYHPGGHFILTQYDEKDATDVFEAFHGPEAYERLKKFKGVPVENPAPVDPKLIAFREFRKKLVADGWFNFNPLWSLYKFVTTVALVVVGSYLAVKGWWVLGSILAGFGFQQCGWLAHDLCHHNATPWRSVNIFLSYFTGNILNGFSCNWWKNRHNTHHAITNVLDSDPDVDNLPFFVWEEVDLPKVADSWLATNIVSFQEYYFIPWTTTLRLIWQLQSIAFVLTPEVNNKSFKGALKYERATIAIHWIWYLLVAWNTPTWTSMFGFIAISEAIGGAGIALIVFMNHYALDMCLQQDRKGTSFLDLQMNGTRNIVPTQLNNWLSGGLNMQIEHHLFPTMPRNNLYHVRPMVKEFCKKNGIVYEELSYLDCLRAVESKLHRISSKYQQMAKKVN